MRTLFIAEQLDRPESRVIAGLAEAGLDVELLLDPADPRFDGFAETGVRTHPLVLRGRYDRQAMRMIRERSKAGLDVIHCLRNNRPLANARAALIGLGKTKPVKLVAYRGTMGNLSRVDPASRATYLSRRVDRLVCVSEGVRQYLLGMGVPADKAVTIHKGHIPAWYCDAPPLPRSELGIPADSFVVGLVANMRPLKGTDLLIEAVDQLKRARRVDLVLVGEVRDDKLRRILDARAQAATDLQQSTGSNFSHPSAVVIHELGFRSDATRIAGMLDAIAMPSRRREGLPRSVIEAMAQGVPAVVSDVGGLPELVRDGVDGLVVPANEVAGLAAALQRLYDDDPFRAQCAANAGSRIATDFHVSRTIEKTLAMYRGL